jgi:hypothetical protein
MGRRLVTRDSDAKTIDLDKEEAECADITANAGRVILVDGTGIAIGTPTNKLEVEANLETGDIEIGAVEIKNATDDTRAIVTTTNQLKVFDDVSNSLIPSVFDYIGVTYPTTTSEVYVYKTGGSGGTTVSTITLVYTDTTKGFISSLTKS